MASIRRFVPNHEDNLHCFQCCYQMVYEALTGKLITSSQAEQMTNFVSGKPTWSFSGMLSLLHENLNVKYIENFPYSIFIEDPERALKIQYSDEELVQSIVDVSDLNQEREFARQCYAHPNFKFEERIPNVEDINELLLTDNLLIANVNYCALLDKEDFAGHFVIVDSLINGGVVLQNPGLPPLEEQKVSFEKFTTAWHYPDEMAANLIAVSK